MYLKRWSIPILLLLLAATALWAAAPLTPTVSSGKGLAKPPQAPQPPQAAELADDGTASVPGEPPGPRAPVVLWNQPLSSVNTSAYVDQDFPDFPTYSSFLADDFTNPLPWSLTAIFVPGDGWNGFSTLANATDLNWAIYADAGGVPDGDPSGGGNPPFWTLSLSPSDPQVTLSAGSSGLPSDVLLTLDTPVSLPPGTWWLVFYPSMPFASGGQYGRQPADTTNGNNAQFINPGGAFGYGTAWQDWAVLNPAKQDMAFRLEGELASCSVLYDNGPLVNQPGDCAGMDASRLQTSLGMSTLGFGHQVAYGYRIADDFTLLSQTQIDQIDFFAYQTGSSTTSPITGVYYQIWDGPPNAGGTVVFGDLTTNRLVTTQFSGIQRDNEGSTCANNRYIFRDTCSAGVSLPPGTYWLEWMTDGSLASGPWAPPITINGQTTTGNALQYTTGWANANDSASGTQQGFPFILYACAAGCPPITIAPAPPLPAMVRGVPYSVTFTASGGTGPYAYTLTGAVPPGMVWDAATATLSGTPSWVGAYDFTIEATDAGECTGSESYTLSSLPNYGLHFADNYGRSEVCIDVVTGSYWWKILSGPYAAMEFSGMGVVKNGGTAFWTDPSDPVYIYAVNDVRRKRARAYLNDSDSGAYSTINDTNTLDNGPCP